MKNSLPLLALVFAACTPMTPAQSTSSVLAPEQTWVIVARPAQPTALDVLRIFQARGLALTDMTSDDRGVTLRFKGDRKTVSETIVTGLDVVVAVADVAEALDTKHEHRHHHHHYDPQVVAYDLGSVFYVRVEPRGETMTSIAVIGRPTNGGVEACTNDPTITAPCAPLETGDEAHPEVAGIAEAEVINGVFAELRLSGAVVAPNVAEIEASRKCWNRRREVERAAARVDDKRAKAGIMRTAPDCSAPPQPVAAN